MFLGCASCAIGTKESFVLLPPQLFTQLIQSHSARNAIKPAGTVGALGARSSRQLPEGFCGEFFSTCGILHHARYDPGNVGILRAKGSLKVESGGLGRELCKRLAVCLHIFLNDREARNVTKISIHSYRMTLFGATVVARRAGTKFATNATNNRTAAVAEKARTSAVPTP